MTVPRAIDVGVLLPHFGSAARRDLLRDVAAATASAGLRSLWARDHLLYGPHGMEDPDPTFLETFTTLGYAAAVAPGLDLGTAAVVPIRNPLVLAKSAATAAALTSGRLRLGIGAGFRDMEFAAVGLDTDLRTRAREVVPETLAILRGLRGGGPVEGGGPHFPFDAVQQWPALGERTQLLYCGTSPLAVRLATGHAQGWVPGRITSPTLRRRLHEADAGEDFEVVVIPLVVIAESKQQAARQLDLPSLLDYANTHRWLDPPDGRSAFTSADELDGIVLYGDLDDVLAGVDRLRQAGATQAVLDFRLTWEAAPEQIMALGPLLTGRGGPASGPRRGTSGP